MRYMDNLYASIPINIRKGVEIMKKRPYLSNMILFSIASMFVIASDVITNSGSIIFWGEPKCPKNLLK